MNLRKLSLTKETIFADAGRPVKQPICRAFAVAVVSASPPYNTRT